MKKLTKIFALPFLVSVLLSLTIDAYLAIPKYPNGFLNGVISMRFLANVCLFITLVFFFEGIRGILRETVKSKFLVKDRVDEIETVSQND